MQFELKLSQHSLASFSKTLRVSLSLYLGIIIIPLLLAVCLSTLLPEEWGWPLWCITMAAIAGFVIYKFSAWTVQGYRFCIGRPDYN